MNPHCEAQGCTNPSVVGVEIPFGTARILVGLCGHHATEAVRLLSGRVLNADEVVHHA